MILSWSLFFVLISFLSIFLSWFLMAYQEDMSESL